VVEVGYELLNRHSPSDAPFSSHDSSSLLARFPQLFPALTYGLIGLIAGGAIVGAISLLRHSSYFERAFATTAISSLSSASLAAARSFQSPNLSASAQHLETPYDSVSISLRVTPKNARIVADGSVVSDGILLVPRSDLPIHVFVSADGFRSRSFSVSAQNNHSVDVHLSRLDTTYPATAHSSLLRDVPAANSR